MLRTLLTAVALLTLCAPAPGQKAGKPRDGKPPRVLPGLEASGLVRLHNAWAIHPAGKQIQLGDFPVNSALHPSGKWLAVLHAGYGDHEVQIVDLDPKQPRVINRAIVRQTFNGLAFAPDGKTVYASGGEFDVVHAFPFADGYLGKPTAIPVYQGKDKFIPSGIAVDPASKRLCVAGTWGHAVALVSLPPRDKDLVNLPLGKDSYPFGCLVDSKRNRLYVSLWNKAQVAVVDLKTTKVTASWDTDKHPTEMLLSPDGKHLFVACANSTRVSVLDASSGKGLETIACALHPNAPPGNTPNSLSLTPDGQVLFVANADNNNVALFNVSTPGKARPMGFIPTGMYPTSVRYNPADKKVYIVNARGANPRGNRHGPKPGYQPGTTLPEYIATLYRGTLSVLDMPTEERIIAYTKLAYACSPLKADLSVPLEAPKDNPIPAKLGGTSPIKHCIYIIRENRTYDQVFGDMKEGNGDPSLCLFPEKVTPNAHRLARQFVLLDNFYVDGEVSADGHEWSMGAYCTDFVKRVWPLSYRGSPLKKLNIYPSEGTHDDIARPAGGYIWDRCSEAGVSYRSYGEWIANGKTLKDPGMARVKALEGHFDPWFRGYDLDYPDVKRAERFIQELKEFEKKGNLPQFIVMRLPNDHTYGTRVGKPTPTAMVAENDHALGLVVEAISKSKFWKETAIFVVEDDAQNGPDHVDAHRTVALVISPYTKRGAVDSTMYSTSSMLRTMELILGLRPMSQFDAAATPMYNSFQSKPDFRTYKHVVPDVDMKAVNPKTAWGAELSEKFNLAVEDAADDLLFNEVIWRSVRGSNSPMPAPVRAAFVFPKLPRKE
ncbi:MAG: bifunctional YncE family protein/alkaline phosphatase family protein [Gemmataceae bacterium]|nr:bifunctional YncE family protein/alkaline phosphatase family protein [Gemmataceae bacterium]